MNWPRNPRLIRALNCSFGVRIVSGRTAE
jgi:hypothetical protein